MSTTAVGSSTSTPASSLTSASGFNMNSTDFVKMMITQLQNQDPLNPTNSDQLMSQMSAIGQMQASSTLQTTLTGLAQQMQIGAASGLIGKTVTGIDSSNNAVSGLVTSVQVSSSGANLQLDNGGTLSLAQVTNIMPATTATAGAAKAS